MRDLANLTDDELEDRLLALTKAEKEFTIDVIDHLAELHQRHLATRRGYSGLFRYCTLKLNYSPDEAMRRITVARLAAEFPLVIDLLREGKTTVTTVNVLSPLLTEFNREALLRQAAGLSKYDVEKMAATINPRPDKRDHIQILPDPAAAASPEPAGLPLDGHPASITPDDPPSAPPLQPQPAIPPESRDTIEPLAPGRVHFGFTGSEDFKSKLDRAKALVWHKFPRPRLEEVLGQALEDMLEKRDPDRRPPPRRPDPPAGDQARTRYIPTWVRADVWKRDEGRCAFITADGVRCCEQSSLEYDHIEPFALGGPSDDPGNIRLLCRAHNQMEGRAHFVGYRSAIPELPGLFEGTDDRPAAPRNS